MAKYGRKRSLSSYGRIAYGAGALGYSAYKRFKRGPKVAPRSAVRRKMGRSFTKTTTKTKTQNVSASSAGSTFSGFRSRTSRSKYLRKLWKAMTPPGMYLLDSSGRIESNNGEQGSKGLSHLDQTDVGFGFTAAGITTGETGKLFLQGYTASLMMTNQDSGNCVVTLYDCISRRDSQESDLSDIYDDGLKENAGATGNTKSIANLNVTPYQSAEFCSKFKILKKTVLSLSTGQSHTHRVTIKSGRTFSRDLLDDYNWFRGVSHHTFMTVHGMPYNDLTTQTNVAVGDTALNYVLSKKIHYRKIDDNHNSYGYSKGQASIATESVMNKLGAVIADAEA